MVDEEKKEIIRADLKTGIDIHVPTHNKGIWGLELTMSCLKNLYLYTQHPFHLIITDDSTDLKSQIFFDELRKEYDNITYIHSEVPYKCGNQFFNIALQHCKYDFLATVMNSVSVQPEWEYAAIETLKADPKIGTIGLKCLFPQGTIESAGIRLVNTKEIGGIEIEGWFPTDIGTNLPSHLFCLCYEREAVQWAFAIHRKEALTGNLEENIYHGFVGWDDIDNCFVLKKKGWKIMYCGAGVGYHIPRATRGVSLDNKEVIRLNKENGEIFRKRWGLNGKKSIQELQETKIINRAERRRRAKVNV